MPDKKNEKIKLYLVMGLACVALVIAYFQFLRPKDTDDSGGGISNAPQNAVTRPMDPGNSMDRRPQTITRSAAQPARVATRQASNKVVRYPINPVTKRDRQIQSGSASNVQNILAGPIRDIFERPYIPAELEQPTLAGVSGMTVAKAVPPKEVILVLKGTILSGDRPMAIINDQFVRLGDEIESFRVTRISSNEVVLKTGTQQKIIQVMKMEAYLDQ